MVNFAKRMIIVRGLTLANFFFSLIFVGQMCVCVSRPMKIDTFLRKNGDSQKRVVDFLRERDTFRNKIIEIVEDFACEAKFLHVFIVHHFSSFFRFFHFFIFLIVFHFSIFSCFFLFFIFSFFRGHPGEAGRVVSVQAGVFFSETGATLTRNEMSFSSLAYDLRMCVDRLVRGFTIHPHRSSVTCPHLFIVS